MLRKLIIVYNPRSSGHAAVQREVLAPARKLSGWLVGKYEIQPTDVDANAANLAKLVSDGDLVVAVGGDGTAAVAANGVMLSEKDATFSVLGYGNFNDVARLLGTKRPVEYGGEYVGGIMDIVKRFEAGTISEIYPLEAVVNEQHWRFAPCYITLGMFAESVGIFVRGEVRKQLKTGKKGLIYSIWQLAKWYFQHRKDNFFGPKGSAKPAKKTKAKYEPPLIIINGADELKEKHDE